MDKGSDWVGYRKTEKDVWCGAFSSRRTCVDDDVGVEESDLESVGFFLQLRNRNGKGKEKDERIQRHIPTRMTEADTYVI